ncbi:hypothetical protein SAMN02787118_11134 [Streptomyces mirabilis]|uniref:Uncharacterized protein n=1 Tax=Streptomyces mirabilis TaxID=68239 RepID=A0A1I2KWL4_9ACTN|nr:hypothetical protein SAMN02787118_11134 [Streptomyces mirabilis]
MSDRDKHTEILALRHQITCSSSQLSTNQRTPTKASAGARVRDGYVDINMVSQVRQRDEVWPSHHTPQLGQ